MLNEATEGVKKKLSSSSSSFCCDCDCPPALTSCNRILEVRRQVDFNASEEEHAGSCSGEEARTEGEEEEEMILTLLLLLCFPAEKILQHVSKTSRTVHPYIFSMTSEQSRLSHEYTVGTGTPFLAALASARASRCVR